MDSGPHTWSCRCFGGLTSLHLPTAGLGEQPYNLIRPHRSIAFSGIVLLLIHFWLCQLVLYPYCTLIGKGSFSQSGSFYFFCSPIHLTPVLPATPLLLDTHPTGSNMLFPLPVFQVDPQNPYVARNHFPIHPHPIIRSYMVPYSSPVANSTPEPLISDLLRRKKLRCLTTSPFNTPILAVKKP